ncbi:hypothetical protein HAX54_017265 [Datura stramonium]|uniref:Uncharacterized protein n=1 Tax=Datura stramonium TaxID=4076 RepID=A0ABS8UMP3_DATST|nr:hypothetical protein [Datura stramonium]
MDVMEELPQLELEPNEGFLLGVMLFPRSTTEEDGRRAYERMCSSQSRDLVCNCDIQEDLSVIIVNFDLASNNLEQVLASQFDSMFAIAKITIVNELFPIDFNSPFKCLEVELNLEIFRDFEISRHAQNLGSVVTLDVSLS